ncbi:hypothetical protein GCM10009557_73620 [Virgisporangium ochraceum]|uniref:Luciferase-like domain-containing protein n=1 Tax=Virgisporangium ochraceum TaxID=65505 RepID=A0A8J4EDK6_9ACTN|nr:hypothetical protein Voc01_057110 [Virgisporangium ochraceum]
MVPPLWTPTAARSAGPGPPVPRRQRRFATSPPGHERHDHNADTISDVRNAQLPCVAYRNPNLLADMARTVDLIADGRLVLGLGAGWFHRDFQEYGYEVKPAPELLRDLAGALPVIRERLSRLNPPPPRGEIPILIGGTGEKVTLRLVAEHAQIWNAIAETPQELAGKAKVLDRWCERVGRDPATIERSVALFNDSDLDDLDGYLEAGFTHFIWGAGGPDYDLSGVRRLLAWRAAVTGSHS